MADKTSENINICDVTDNKKSNCVNDNEKVNHTFEDALEIAGNGRYSYSVLAIVIYSLLAATAEMFTIGVVTTAAQCDLDLDVNKKGLMSSIPILVGAYPVLNMTFSYYIPLLGYSFHPWRLYLLGIGLVSGINLLLIMFFTFESPKFYFAIREHNKGLEIMQKINKVNTGSAVEDYPVKHVVLNAGDYKPKQRSFILSVWEQTIPLFNKIYIKNTILIFLCCLPSYCVSPPFAIWLPFIMNSVSKVRYDTVSLR